VITARRLPLAILLLAVLAPPARARTVPYAAIQLTLYYFDLEARGVATPALVEVERAVTPRALPQPPGIRR